MRSELLIRVVALQDAFYTPRRLWKPPHIPAYVDSRRLAYQQRGLPWRSEGADATERKRVERELSALAGDDLIRTFRAPGGKTTAVQLTDSGDWSARQMARLPGRPGCLSALHHLADLSEGDRAAVYAAKPVVSESVFADVTPENPKAPDEYQKVIDFLLPAIVRGWVVSESTLSGHVAYWLTPAGWQLVATTPTEGRDDYSSDPSGNAIYDAALCEAWRAIDATPVIEIQEIGRLPLRPLLTRRECKSRSDKPEPVAPEYLRSTYAPPKPAPRRRRTAKTAATSQSGMSQKRDKTCNAS